MCGFARGKAVGTGFRQRRLEGFERLPVFASQTVASQIIAPQNGMMPMKISFIGTPSEMPIVSRESATAGRGYSVKPDASISFNAVIDRPIPSVVTSKCVTARTL